MPGKYSHSVVLAGYSSRGIISLPNDQHVAYLKTSPYSSEYGGDGSRAQSQVSHTSKRRSRTVGSASEQRDRPSTGVSSSGRHIIIDPTTIERQDVSIVSEQQTVQQSSYNASSVLPNSRRVYNQQGTKAPDSGVRPKTSAGVTSIEEENGVRNLVVQSSTLVKVPLSLDDMHSAIKVHSGRPRLEHQEISDLGVRNAESSPSNVSAPPASPYRIVGNTVPTQHNSARSTEDLHRQLSNGTLNTQIYRPLSPAVELDFEGFSDSEEMNTSYFEPSSIPRGTGAPDAGAGMLSSLRKSATPPPGQSSQSRQSHTRTLQSSSSAPSDRFLTATPDDQQGNLNSLTSLSSLGSWGTPSNSRNSRLVESNKVTILPQASVERLPGIGEDDAYGPDLYAQSLDAVKPSAHLRFGERSLGMVSSGRDVVFDPEGDNRSLASAACPPDIGRVKDNPTSGAAPTLYSARAYDIRSSSTQDLSAQTKKKGLFSRFRSKH